MPTLLITDDGTVRTLTLNRPEQRNALTPGLQDELLAALADAAAASHLRVLVLTGAGSGFCAGLDLSELQAMGSKTADEA